MISYCLKYDELNTSSSDDGVGGGGGGGRRGGSSNGGARPKEVPVVERQHMDQPPPWFTSYMEKVSFRNVKYSSGFPLYN